MKRDASCRERRPPWLARLVLCVFAAAIGAPAAASADEAAGLGRLFLTPEQRRVLDEQRSDPAIRIDTRLPKDLLPARLAVDRRVVVNGLVRRGDADPVVWINGQRASGAPIAAGRLRVRHGTDRQNRVTLEGAGGKAVARLKPGQAWDPRTGAVTDCIECGAPKPAGDTGAEPPAGAESGEPAGSAEAPVPSVARAPAAARAAP